MSPNKDYCLGTSSSNQVHVRNEGLDDSTEQIRETLSSTRLRKNSANKSFAEILDIDLGEILEKLSEIDLSNLEVERTVFKKYSEIPDIQDYINIE